eukprot:3214980-Heterocapsa_arctica.AAC.1
MGRVARVTLGMELSPADARAAEALIVHAREAAASGGVTFPPMPPESAIHKVKISSTLDQLYDDEIAVVKPDVFLLAYATYAAKLGGAPMDEEDVTAEQYSALRHQPRLHAQAVYA